MLYSHFIKIYLLSFYRSIHVNKIKRIIGLVGYHTISVNQKQTKLCWPIFCVSTCISLSVIVWNDTLRLWIYTPFLVFGVCLHILHSHRPQ